MLIKYFVIAALVLCSFSSRLPAGLDISLNEIRVSEPATDMNNFFEVAGDPNQSLTGVSLVTVNGRVSPGEIEFVTDLGALAIPADGYLLAHQTLMPPDADVTTGDDYLGSSMTFLLVDGFTGSIGDDLDMNNDGDIDQPIPWDSIYDGVMHMDGIDGINYFHVVEAGHDTLGAAHIYRLPNRSGPWNIGTFDDFSLDTPGTENIPEPAAGLMTLAIGSALMHRKSGHRRGAVS